MICFKNLLENSKLGLHTSLLTKLTFKTSFELAVVYYKPPILIIRKETKLSSIQFY